MRRSVRLGLTTILLVIAAACGGNGVADTTAAPTPTAAPAPTETSAAADTTTLPPDTTIADELEKTSLKVGVIPIGDLMQVWVADSLGYFTEEGLEVELVSMAGSAAIAPAVESGDLDIGSGNVFSLILARDAGFDFTHFSGAWYQGEGAWNHSLLIPPDSDITDIAGLAGKTVAINTLRNINELTVAALLSENGVDYTSVNFTEVPFPEMAPALAQGRVDAALVVEPFVTIATGDGSAVVLDPEPYAVWGDEILLGGIFSTRTWLDAHPNTAAAFDRAIQKATDLISDDLGAAAKTLADYTSMSEELASQITHPLFKDAIAPAEIQPWLDGAVEFGYLESAFDPAEIVWP